jgi:hypothetical protein
MGKIKGWTKINNITWKHKSGATMRIFKDDKVMILYVDKKEFNIYLSNNMDDIRKVAVFRMKMFDELYYDEIYGSSSINTMYNADI